jgi:hypothetical protein
LDDFAALEALLATSLNSAPVQPLEVLISEMVPAAAVASKGGDDGFSILTFNHKHEVTVARREVEVGKFAPIADAGLKSVTSGCSGVYERYEYRRCRDGISERGKGQYPIAACH